MKVRVGVEAKRKGEDRRSRANGTISADFAVDFGSRPGPPKGGMRDLASPSLGRLDT